MSFQFPVFITNTDERITYDPGFHVRPHLVTVNPNHAQVQILMSTTQHPGLYAFLYTSDPSNRAVSIGRNTKL